jgi:hypothetical protein
MAMIDRHRVARLIELSAAERTLKGPERLLREDDVAQLVRAAFDDAAEKARADFMARINRSPSSAWPWSAVQAQPGVPPAAVILLLGQVESPDSDRSHRVPDRAGAEGAAWEPLYRALETWDTATTKRWMHAGGWARPGASAPRTEVRASASGMTAGRGVAAPTRGPNPPPSNPPAGSDPPPAGSEPPSGGPPATSPPAGTPAEMGTWTTDRIVLAAGAAVVVTGVVVYSAISLSRTRETERLSARLRAQEEQQ